MSKIISTPYDNPMQERRHIEKELETRKKKMFACKMYDPKNMECSSMCPLVLRVVSVECERYARAHGQEHMTKVMRLKATAELNIGSLIGKK